MSRGGAKGKQAAEESRAKEALGLEAAIHRRKRIRTVTLAALSFVVGVGFVVLDPPAPGVAAPVVPPSHIAAVDQPHAGYTSLPPSSGAHTGGMVPVGLVADEPIEPEAYLHFMEDAGIGLFYDCDDCQEVVGGLISFMEKERTERLFVAPYDRIEDSGGRSYPIAAVAWGRILYLDDLSERDLDELTAFVAIFEGIDHHAG